MIYFTSDWHIGHDKEFLWRPRGFNNITEMNEAIIKNCNKILKPEDTLFILGDLALGQNEPQWNQVYYNINCPEIYFITGNHDTANKIKKYTHEYGLTSLGEACTVKLEGYHFFLSHYPTLVGNYDDNDRPLNKRLINLCGHSHTKDRFADFDKGLIYHVELDAHDNQIVSLEQIIKDIHKKVINI